MGSGVISSVERIRPFPGKIDWKDAACLLAVLLFLCLAFNGTSLWIDEGYSAYIGSQHRFSDLIDALRASDSGDLQTAGYYVYLWAWVHCFGFSEFALRASNLPFLIVVCVALRYISRQLFHSRYAWILPVLCPFVWFYLNEARVYLLLMAVGSLATAACLASIYGRSPVLRRTAAFVCLLTLWMGAVADILAIFIFPGLLLLVLTSDRRRIRATWLWPALATLPLFILDAGYTLWTLRQPTNMHYDQFNPLYILLFFYELLGLQGIGPDRNQLRLFSSGGVSAISLVGAGVLGVVGVLACIVLYRGRRHWRRRQALWLAGAGATALASLCVVSLILQERFLPRHASTILPLFLIALIPLTAGRNPFKWGSSGIAAAALFGIWLISDGRLSFDSRYQKDDFRDAVPQAIALANEPGATVLWVGDYFTAFYYGLRLDDSIGQLKAKLQADSLLRDTGWRVRGRAIFGNFFSESQVKEAIQSAPARDHIYLVATKLDLYDLRHAWGPLIQQHAQELPIHSSPFVFYKLNLR